MPARKGQRNEGEPRESQFRGRTIRVEPPSRGRGVRLLIDDVEVEVEETESGVVSHASAFKEYGSVEELAEDLIRQHGTRPIEAAEHGGHGAASARRRGERPTKAQDE